MAGNINFRGFSSSVIGLNDFCQETVDFALSDTLLCGRTIRLQPRRRCRTTTSTVPYVGESLAFEYNLTGAERASR